MRKFDARPLTLTALPLGLALTAISLGGLLGGGGKGDAAAGTREQLKELARRVEAAAAAQKRAPASGEDFILLFQQSQSGVDLVEDQWGTPFVPLRMDIGFAIVSCGQDGDCNTKDDFAAYGSWPGKQIVASVDEIPGWPTDRPADPAATISRLLLGWLRANPWLGGGFIALWAAGFAAQAILRRKHPPEGTDAAAAPEAPEEKVKRPRLSNPDPVVAPEPVSLDMDLDLPAVPAAQDGAPPPPDLVALDDPPVLPPDDGGLVDLGFGDDPPMEPPPAPIAPTPPARPGQHSGGYSVKRGEGTREVIGTPARPARPGAHASVPARDPKKG